MPPAFAIGLVRPAGAARASLPLPPPPRPPGSDEGDARPSFAQRFEIARFGMQARDLTHEQLRELAVVLYEQTVRQRNLIGYLIDPSIHRSHRARTDGDARP